jgi:8-oxo-dGTP diphosphatase
VNARDVIRQIAKKLKKVSIMGIDENKKRSFHPLARAVILSNEHILVAHCKGMDNTFLPGGHVEYNEGIKRTLTREIEEEMGLNGRVIQYLGTVEAHFDLDDKFHQEVNHLFLFEIPEINNLSNLESKESHLEFYWVHYKDMKKENLQPYPLRKLITE